MGKPTRFMRRDDRDRIHRQTGKLCDAAALVRRSKRETERTRTLAEGLATALHTAQRALDGRGDIAALNAIDEIGPALAAWDAAKGDAK